jgi:ubiquitin-protein ligase
MNRLRYELEQMHRLKREAPNTFNFIAYGDPPEKYEVEFRIRSLKDIQQTPQGDWQPLYADVQVAVIELPADFPDVPPEMKIYTPIFHPNISSTRQNTYSIRNAQERYDQFSSQTDKDAFKKWWDEEPSLGIAHICLDILKENWVMDYTVRDVCIEVAAMIAYKPNRYRGDDGYNQRAMAYVREYPQYFPTDPRDFIEFPESEDDFDVVIIDTIE